MALFPKRLGINTAALSASAQLPTSGLVAKWDFNEGSGTTVADSFSGTYPINLDLPTTPNYTWSSTGIDLAAGLVQTPSLPSVRTVATLYKTGFDQNGGFLVSGGSGSGSGITQQTVVPAETTRVGVANGIRPLIFRASNGDAAFVLNRGGWVLLIRELPSQFTSAFGFGGRHSTTTSRCANYSIAWAAAYSGQLTDATCLQIYNYLRPIMVDRGIYIDKTDCPIQADCGILWGQSNGLGRALISGLPLADRTYTSSKTYIEAASYTIRGTLPPAFLQMGGNQTVENVATQFGPELAIAKARDTAGGRDLYISKTAAGSFWLAPSSSGVSTANTTWYPTELPTNAIFNYAISRDWSGMEQNLLLNGIGPNLRVIWWMHGEQDATSLLAVPTLGAYQANLEALYDNIETYLNYPDIPIVVGRIRDQDPTFNPTAVAYVRADEASFVAAHPTSGVLINTDTFPLMADQVHYDTTGQLDLGTAFYNAVAW